MARRRSGWWGWAALIALAAIFLGNINRSDTPTTATPPRAFTAPILTVPGAPKAAPDPATGQMAVSPRTLLVNADTLNVRASPNTSARVLLKVSRGTAVIATVRSGSWFGVQLTDGSTGWLHGDYLAESSIAPLLKAPESTVANAPTRPAYNRDEVVQAIIEASLSRYPGPCPCEYNRMRNGRRCGGNSAHSKGGGYSPICYPEEVTQAMIDDFLAHN